MAAPVFIGDPVTGAGYRLAGVIVRTPDISGAAIALQSAIEDAPPLIVLTSHYARSLPAVLLEDVLLAFAPPVLIVPDAPGIAAMPDWGQEIRQWIMAE